VASLTNELKAGKARPQGAIGPLSEVTRKRYAARKDKLASIQAARARRDIATALDQFSWQFLAASAAGDTDLEALTELQIAWKSPHTAELLAGPGRALALRSLWCICEAARNLPGESELSTLATTVREQSANAAEEAANAVAKNRGDTASLLGVLYAALATPNNRAYQTRAKEAVTSKEGDSAQVAEACTLGRILLDPAGDADRHALADLVRREGVNPNQVVLLALACRVVGSGMWDEFRAQARNLLGTQPLPGEIVVYVNQLSHRP
jgi:hypothetical protein